MQTRDQDASLQYIRNRFVFEPPAFAQAYAQGERLRPGMQVSAYEGHLLHFLLKMSAAQNALEIGSFVGYSTLWQAHALPEKGRLTSLEFNADYAALTRQHVADAGFQGRVEVHHTDALAFLENYDGPLFDYLFIDAVKKDYPHYLEAALPHLTPDAWVLADNALLFGAFTSDTPYERVSQAAKDGMNALHERIATSGEFEATMLPTPEGLIVAKRRA